MKRINDFKRLFIGGLMGCLLALFLATPVWSAVTLKSFDVRWNGSRVVLKWETATEMDNLGFMVKRKLTNGSGDFQVVELCAKETVCTEEEKEDFIDTKGDISGYTYGNYYDDSVEEGRTYTYQLIAIDTNQQEEIAETKTIRTILETPTPTPTSTSTITLTPTPTATATRTTRPNNPNRTRTTVPPTPTATARVLLATPTIPPAPPTVQTPTSTPEPLPTETTQIIEIPTLPLPSITLIYPDTPTPMLENQSPTPEVGSVPDNARWLTPGRLLVIGVIVFIWLILGGAFVFALRKIQ
ncbi:MAG: Outer membrane autotransporter barrel [Anaerolineae bacterium]|nr:MAG: Outer membrane autotransporter barrel [Anaerolineae bacterium]